jgi:hypothetical protein
MNAWRISIWCWVIFVVGMIGLAPAFATGSAAVVIAEQAIAWSAFAYAMYISMVVVRGGDKRLIKRGLAGTAKVLSAKRTNTVVQEGEFAWEAPYVWKYGLEVTLPHGSPYETMLYICARLSEGETIPVRVSKLNRKRVTIDRDAYNQQLQARGPHAVTRRRGARRAVVTDPEQLMSIIDQARSQRAGPVDVADELTKLAALHDRGVLTDAEFAAQKAKLLGQ